MEADFIPHHADPRCTSRITLFGYCPACRLFPEAKDTNILAYCPNCVIPLLENLKCPECGQKCTMPR